MKKVKSVKSPYGAPRWTVLLKATWSVYMLALAAAVNISCKVWTSSPSMNLASTRKLLSAWLKIHREKSQEAHTHTSRIMYLSMAACVACVYISLCVCFFWWDLAVFSVTTCLCLLLCEWLTATWCQSHSSSSNRLINIFQLPSLRSGKPRNMHTNTKQPHIGLNQSFFLILLHTNDPSLLLARLNLCSRGQISILQG